MSDRDDYSDLADGQKQNQDMFDLAWARTQKQAVDLQSVAGLSAVQVADLYIGIGISVALALCSGQELAEILRLQADDLESGHDTH